MWQNIEFSLEETAIIDTCYMVRDRVRVRHEAQTQGTSLPAWADPALNNEEAAARYFDGKNLEGDPLGSEDVAVYITTVVRLLDLFADLSDQDLLAVTKTPLLLLLEFSQDGKLHLPGEKS